MGSNLDISGKNLGLAFVLVEKIFSDRLWLAMKTDAYRITEIDLRMVRVTIGIRYATDKLNAAHALIVRLAGSDAEGLGRSVLSRARSDVELGSARGPSDDRSQRLPSRRLA